MGDPLATALDELELNVKQPMPLLQVQGKDVIPDIKEQAEIVLGIVKAELDMLNDDKKNPQEKNNQLSPLYKIALRNHYLKMIETLNAALKETNPEQHKKHADKLEELANISKPRLKAALHALAGYFSYIAGLFTAAQIGTLITLAPATYGGSLLAILPVSMAADEMKKKGKDFFSESQKNFNDAWAIKETQEKIKFKKQQHNK